MISSCLSHIKDKYIKEAMIRIIAYISNQLVEEDFTKVFNAIFSQDTQDDYLSLGLKFLKLSPEIIKHSQLSLLVDKSLEKRGTSFDRDFIEFILNHNRDDLFPGKDVRIDNILKNYFDIKIEEHEHLSLQWLMDLQKFIEKGFIQLDEYIEKKVLKFVNAALKIVGIHREWRIFSDKMIPVYKTFATLFDKQIISKIIEVYLKDENGQNPGEIPLNELDEKTRDSFAHLLKEIFLLRHHKDLNKKVIDIIKKFVKQDLTGGGYIGAFWKKLAAGEKEQLIEKMKAMWMPSSEKNILKAVEAAGEFLKYQTDEELMKELSNRLLYSIFSGSTTLKITWCKTIAVHVEEETPWFTANKEKIIEHFDYLKMEKDLELLRQFLELAKLLERKDINVGDIIAYLKDNAPYAEIKRTAKNF